MLDEIRQNDKVVLSGKDGFKYSKYNLKLIAL